MVVPGTKLAVDNVDAKYGCWHPLDMETVKLVTSFLFLI